MIFVKRLISLMIAISFILPLGISFNVTASDEVVFEDSFENGGSAWVYTTTKANDSNTKMTDEKASDGKISAWVKDEDEAAAFGYRSSIIPAEEGVSYTVSGDLYMVEGIGAKIFLRFIDSDGKSLISQSTYTKNLGKWENVSLTLVAPQNTVAAYVYITGSSVSKGETYADNIKLVKNGSIPKVEYEKPEITAPEEYLFFEDFENGISDWRFSNTQSEERIKEENVVIASGEKSVRIADDELVKAIGLTSVRFKVTGGKTYTVAADMYMVSGTSIKLYVRTYDSSNTRIQNFSFTSKGRKWATACLTFDAAENACEGELVISGVSTSQGEAVIDNIRVVEGKQTLKSDFSNAVSEVEEKEFSFSNAYEMPDFKPAEGHPRLYFNKADIERIKANATHPQNESAYRQFMKEVNSTEDGSIIVKTGNNLNSRTMSVIQSKAFYYAVWGDETKGKEAVAALKNFLTDANVHDSEYNAQGFLVFTIAAVYDWCYPLLTDEDKSHFQNMGLITASTMEIGFPPVGGSVLNAHSAEAMLQRDQMAFAIAVYDERPDIYQNVAGRFFSEMVDSKKFLANAHSSMFGNSYSTYRYQWEILACYMMEALGIEKIYGEEHSKVLYWNLYARRPDGSMLKDGDSVSGNQPIGPYDERGTRAYFLAGNYYKDPYLKGEALRHNNGLVIGDVSSNQTLSSIEVLCFNDPEVSYKTVKELPLSKYFPSPRGEMIARTSWAEGIDAPSAVVQMKIDEYWTQGHDHLDSGEFEIYYKGALANDTGYYQAGRDGSTAENSGNTVSGTVHFYNYQRRTIAHNCMIVFDPEESNALYKNYVNDGGQIFANNEESISSVHSIMSNGDRNRVGEIIAHEFGPDYYKPDYTYLKGDIAKAYGEKVPWYERSFMFLNLDNQDVPGVLFVFDRVISKEAHYDKSWVLHGLNEPLIEENRTVFTDTRTGYNGKLTVDTLLPQKDNLDIKVVGGEGQEYLVNGINYWAQTLEGRYNEGGGYRIEVGTKTDALQDYFLNALQISDADGTVTLEKPELIEGETHTGAKLYDRVVMFGKLKERNYAPIEFYFGGEGKFKIAVADLKEGTWQIMRNNEPCGTLYATKEGGVGYFEGESGSYQLTYQGQYGSSSHTYNNNYYGAGVNLKLEPANTYIYSDVEPVIQNGRTLVPMRAIFEALRAEVTWDDATKTAIGKRGGKVIKITNNSSVALVDGKETLLDVPAQIIDGRFVVPVRFVAESFGIKVDWDEWSKTVIINDTSVPE